MVILAFSLASTIGLLAAAGVGSSPSKLSVSSGGGGGGAFSSPAPMRRQDSERSVNSGRTRERIRNDDELWFAAKMDRLQAEEDAAERARLNPYPTSPNLRLPAEILERIIKFAFDAPPSTPTSPRQPFPNALAIVLVAKGFHRVALPLLYRSIYIRKESDWTLFFHHTRGIFNDGQHGRMRREWVREFCVIDDLPPPPSRRSASPLPWSPSSAFAGLVSSRRPDGAVHIPTNGFDYVRHFCIIRSPPKIVACSHLVAPASFAVIKPAGPETVDTSDPAKRHHLLMLSLLKMSNPRTLNIPYAALAHLHLPSNGALLISNGNAIHVSIHFPPPRDRDDLVRIKNLSQCYQAHLPGYVLSLFEALEWTELSLVDFPAACSVALGKSLRKRVEGGQWKDGGLVDWSYPGRWEGVKKEGKELRIGVDLAL